MEALVAAIAALGALGVAWVNSRRVRPRNGHGNLHESMSELHEKVDAVAGALSEHVADDQSHWQPE